MRFSMCTSAWHAPTQSIKALYQRGLWLAAVGLLVVFWGNILKTQHISISPLPADTSFSLMQPAATSKVVTAACVAGEKPVRSIPGATYFDKANGVPADQADASSVSATIASMASVALQFAAAAVIQLAEN
ncbi:hypothetical protein [uncultured Pontibacter sp.]|uniref:hypothetical protein n=1 Tax=uncultured Pontibacter sp. TaxID=453356 RepID=UPI0026271E46|nr:hypothetical protein [uncultured Pontibacter sp.]